MKKRYGFKLFAGVLITSLMMAGCGSAAKDDYAENMTVGSTTGGSTAPGYGSMPTEDSMEYAKPEVNEEGANALSERKLIKNVDMTVETKEFDALITTLQNRVSELGGYIENMETYNGSAYSGHRSNRNASLTIRIPQEKLDGFLYEVEEGCNVIRRSENVKDVTLTYVDLQSHKAVLLAEQERLLELIDEANYIEEIISIEQRLSDVRYQIESMESQLRTFDNQINFSTVSMYVEEVAELTPVEEKSALGRIADGFMKNVNDVAVGVKEFAIWFVISIPYFVVWAIFIVIIVVIFKLIIRKLNKSVESSRKTETDKTEPSESNEQEIKKQDE